MTDSFKPPVIEDYHSFCLINIRTENARRRQDVMNITSLLQTTAQRNLRWFNFLRLISTAFLLRLYIFSSALDRSDESFI
jgi:hypothetical protein